MKNTLKIKSSSMVTVITLGDVHVLTILQVGGSPVLDSGSIILHQFEDTRDAIRDWRTAGCKAVETVVEFKGAMISIKGGVLTADGFELFNLNTMQACADCGFEGVRCFEGTKTPMVSISDEYSMG